MQNLSEMLKGILDGIVLEIISRGEIYGYAIAKELNEMGFRDLAQGTVYALLLRLEKQKLVNVAKKPSRIGPPRKFYTLNQQGLKELRDFWARWAFLKGRVETLKQPGGETDEN